MLNSLAKKVLVVVIVSVFIFPNFSNAITGVAVSFNVLPGIEPKILPMNGQLPISLGVNFNLGQFSSHCGSQTTSSFKWSIYHDSNGDGPSLLSDIQFGSEKTATFSRNSANVTVNINDTITIQDNGQGRTDDFIYKLYAFIECPNGTDVLASAPVQVKAGSGAAIFTCVVPTSGNNFAYSCSPNNTNNCSDNPQCTGKPCFQVRVSLCGDAAPPPTLDTTGKIWGCIAADNKYACSPGNSSSCSDIPNNACAGKSCVQIEPNRCGQPASGGTGGTGGGSGTTQKYSFEIENPLKGDADDLTGLIKVLAQWIFNLAIPIAVIMIIYAGVLFLTAQGNPAQVTKARDVLKYAVIGLAIIFIGSGFVSLIRSILELGSSSPPGQQQLPGGGFPQPGGSESPSVGAVGNKCSRDRDCVSGLRCQDSICKRSTGNLETEPCNSARNCDVGLTCDKSDSGLQIIDGQTLGTCAASGVSGGRIGDVCERDSNCISGLKCNTICQRRDGNLEGESCVRTANPSNCQSTACLTTGSNTVGTCTTNPTR